MEKRYTVRQASEKTGVKSHVLRYWEEELELLIKRNELGHRYYTEYDLQLFLAIKDLKSRGLQLRGIRGLIPQITKNMENEQNAKQDILYLEEKNIADTASETLQNVEKKIEKFYRILEKMIFIEMQRKNGEEKHCRELDQAIRRQQLARKEAAAAEERNVPKIK